MTDDRILWINAGGTIVSKAYKNPYKPPKYVKPLPLDQSEQLVHNVMQELGFADRVDGFTFLGHEWEYDLGQLRKDSKKITDDDIASIAQIIQDSDHHKILITHGTDWMALNAERLKKKLIEIGVTDKTVVFTGAMVPLSMAQHQQSDAPDNLSYVFANIGNMEKGVHVVGRDSHTLRIAHFDPEHLEKDKDQSLKDLKLTFTR